jgi:hypothetical protein
MKIGGHRTSHRARAQKTYRQCELVDRGYFVMEDDFSGAVTHVGR